MHIPKSLMTTFDTRWCPPLGIELCSIQTDRGLELESINKLIYGAHGQWSRTVGRLVDIASNESEAESGLASWNHWHWCGTETNSDTISEDVDIGLNLQLEGTRSRCFSTSKPSDTIAEMVVG